MNEENFKKEIKEIQNIRMTEAEKTRMLKKVFDAPVESPFVRRAPSFVFAYFRQSQVLVATPLVLMLSFGGALYASDKSLPGDILYPIKTGVVEPMLDVINRAPEKKIVWEEEKVTRRIVEAEKLLEKDELDDEKLLKLERSIEKSSFAFTKAADSVASSTGTSTLSRKEKARDLKKEFRGRINNRRGSFDREDDKDKVESSNDEAFGVRVRVEDAEKVLNELNDDRNIQKEKIKRLQNVAIKVLDDDEDGDEDDDNDDEDDRLILPVQEVTF